MAQITSRQLKAARHRLTKQLEGVPQRLLLPVLLGLLIWWPSQKGYWWVALILVVAAEIVLAESKDTIQNRLIERFPALMMAGTIALSISLLPKAASQLALAGAYVTWRFFFDGVSKAGDSGLISIFLVQIAFFEAVFLSAAIAGPSPALTITAVWLGCFGLAHALLRGRGERSTMLMASVWALVAAECSWVFTTWLVSYVTVGGYVIVPQPTLVLSALAYCFGGIYMAQRQNKLSRTRLSEYLFIVLIILAIVIAGTKWRGSL